MDKIKLAREIAARTPTRVLDIPRARRIRAYDAMENLQKRLAAQYNLKTSLVLEAELWRLVRTWNQ